MHTPDGTYMHTPDANDFSYKWQVRSNAGNGDIGSISEVDPAAGQCVEYGDVVMFQVQSMANRWLAGGRGRWKKNVILGNHLGSRKELNKVNSYSWRVRSSPGTGNVSDAADPRGGQCVSYGDSVFLQSQNAANRWLSGIGGSEEDDVTTRNLGGSESLTYRWMLGHEPSVLRVVGEWTQELAVMTCTTYTLTIGWSKTVTKEFSWEVQSKASTSFSVFGAQVSAEVSSKVTRRTSSSMTRNNKTTFEQQMCATDGAYVWAWRFFVQRGDIPVGYITTNMKVQADTRPHCFPGEQADAKYTSCKPGGCLENCWPFKVGDEVLITESGRKGEITRLDLSDRPFFVTFSDGNSPPSGWYPEHALSLDGMGAQFNPWLHSSS